MLFCFSQFSWVGVPLRNGIIAVRRYASDTTDAS
jgi:hypothetical protein